ncbi:hypothetical protein [Streptomyces caatingaensis]|uniref:hypothetical protein n=1 Tax=Streptomyces caatingaensis TaxID=1678637 RepID=UPI0012FF4D7F|nr:hypothetical protein [Streptomyces caatingaensis]
MSGAALAADPRLAAAVGDIGRRSGVDYFDDEAVRAVLGAHRVRHGAATWLCLAAFVGGLGLLVPAAAAGRLLPLAGAAVLLPVSIPVLILSAAVTQQRWRHPQLVAYRQVLTAAAAHGVDVVHVPGWLPRPAAAAWPPSPADYRPRPATPVPVPPEPDAVAEYERLAEKGGRHDEAGWILVLGAFLVCLIVDKPLGWAGLLLVPLAGWVWLAGHRLGRRQRELEEQAREYVRELTAARAHGAETLELSRQLSRLLG